MMEYIPGRFHKQHDRGAEAGRLNSLIAETRETIDTEEHHGQSLQIRKSIAYMRNRARIVKLNLAQHGAGREDEAGQWQGVQD